MVQSVCAKIDWTFMVENAFKELQAGNKQAIKEADYRLRLQLGELIQLAREGLTKQKRIICNN